MIDMLILPPGSKPVVPLDKHPATVPQLAFALAMAKLFPEKLDAKGFRFPDPLQARADIIALERAIEKLTDHQIQFKTTHRWIDGVYTREVFIPKGSIVVGRIHKHACISIMNKGDKSTVSEDGAIRLKAPFATISKPGIKRVGFAHEDTIWTTIHATEERDLKKLEEELFCDSYDGVTFEESDIVTIVTSEGKICRP